jgi:hypothetical protein
MNDDRESLDTQQCLRLMAGMTVGRVVYTLNAMPAVLPVRFRIDPDGSLVLAEDPSAELVRAVDGAVLGRASVAPVPATGTGRAAVAGQFLIRLRPEVVTGRRLTSPATDAPLP